MHGGFYAFYMTNKGNGLKIG